jgi:mannose-6-phosphate isomerase-like protein (cupin superfamily)
MLILEGQGLAVIEGKRRQLKAGSLLLIEKGEKHEIRNTGRRQLQGFVLYTPPAYKKSGTRLPRGKPNG